MSADVERPAVCCRGLVKIYGHRPVLADIDLTIAPGERFCLVGLNGSGKSTLLEILMGIKTFSRGQVEVLGHQPSDSRLKRHRVLLMDRASFPYYAKVKEIVWLHAGFHPGPIDRAALLRSYDLDGNRYVRHLSKGQRQRLSLLITLLGKPALILLDEPTSGLDPQARLSLWQVLDERLGEDERRTLVFATHDLTEAERRADRVAVLHQGRLLAVGPPAELRRSTLGHHRKVTVTASDDLSSRLWGLEDVATVVRQGEDVVLYTDHPDVVLRRIGFSDQTEQIRIENVSLRDAFLRLTGEVPCDAPALAV